MDARDASSTQRAAGMRHLGASPRQGLGNLFPATPPSTPRREHATLHGVPTRGDDARHGWESADGADARPREPVRILLVDDTDRNLMALEAMLGGLDAELVTARSGADALRCLLEKDFALILLDVRMPGLDGFETAELIRARDRSRHTPIMFLTAYEGVRAEEARGYALGAVDFLAKPVIPEVLRGKVAALIELQRVNEELRLQSALLAEAHRREHARALEEERRRWEEEALRREMERERLLASALQRSNARLRLLSDNASALLHAADPVEAAPTVFARAAELGADASLWYGEDLALVASAGLDAAAAAEVERVRAGEPLVARAAAERRAVVLTRAGATADAGVAAVIRANAAAAFPLVAGGRVQGVLAFAARGHTAFEADEISTLALLADHVAAAVERTRLVRELSRVAADLREADVRKDHFLAMLGHELRNPLAPVLNAVKLIQRTGVGDAALERILAGADRQIAHMTRLLDDLLDVSRIRNGKIELKRAPADLRTIVRDALHAIEGLIAERGHSLSVDLPDEPLALEGDAVRLGQVVANLVHNAAKYTDPGGHIAVRAARVGTDLVLHVVDDGVGIAPDMLPRIFDVFVQVEQGSDRARGGLGLGLTLVRSLVEMHGGCVVARSAGLGQGSSFEVRLPARGAARVEAAPCDPAAVAAPRASRAAAAHPLDIVLVEDNTDIRESLRALLELSGHAVAEASDGPTGIELIRARRPNVALVDIGLPGVDGYAVARELREVAPVTRLIAMTGYGRPEDRKLALEAGFHAHLVKPVDFDDLTKLLDDLS
jgi:signal transduction histidine kinase/DNA-binding response OmpR family regulator